MIFEFYEQKYIEKVYLKLNLDQSIKQERSKYSLPARVADFAK